MPAGIVKTPSSARTKDAAVAKSAEKTASGGKKFVQTRLPFKLLTPGGGPGTTASASAPSSASSSAAAPVTVILDDDEPAPRKRKLSYGDESPPEGTGCSAGQLRRSNSKENLDVGSSIATKKVKTAAMDVDSLAEDVIELVDDDGEEMAAEKEKEEDVVVVEVKEIKPKPKKPEMKKASPAPIQIKLPLVGKRSKRRKSLKKSEESADTPATDAGKTGSESSDDIEVLSEELNPQKKQKVQKAVDQSPEKSAKAKKQEEKEEKKSEKQEEPKEAAKKAKEEPKTAEQNKKNDQSTIDLFMAKKVETSKKEKPETKATEKSKKKEQSVAEDSKPKETPEKETAKTIGKSKKEESKPAKNIKKDETKAGTTKSQKEKEDAPVKNQKEELAPAKNQKEETNEKIVVPASAKNTQKKDAAKKAETQTVENEKVSKAQEKTKKEEPSALDKSDKDSPEAAEISVILSSSEGDSSSSDHEMDVDTDTPAAGRTSAQKDGHLLRKSLPEASDAPKTLTPKQQRLLERRKKVREEKEQKLAEERRLKQQEKEQREQQKKQERDEKEQQRKLEKDQKEQLRKTEKEEKERKRQAEVDSKNEEKRKRNEAKEEVQRKRDEERRKKEQEREEAEQKKKRAAESFTKFFVPKQPKAGGGSNNTSYLEHEQSSCDSSKASSQTLAFRPFQIKDDMLLAPIVRTSIGQEQRSQLDGLFRRRDEDDEDDEEEDEEEDIGRRKPPNRAHLYLSELSSGRREPLKMLRDARLQRRTKDEEDEDEVQVIDDLSTAGLPILEEQPKLLARMRAKYLQFADNRRPAYYGTWRKKSASISARRPLAQDKLHFDYELDSDCEWEEEEPGESLSASEDEKERESEEESEEEYNEWYVPHGHLSDEELQNDGDEGMDDGHTREAQQAKLQVLQQEFAQEMKKQTKKIKPRLLGPVWLDENGNKSQLFPAIFAHTIDMYACWQLEPLSLEPPAEPEREDQPPEQPVPLQLDERLMQQLVRLTHGNRNSKAFLINEYLEYLRNHTAAESNQPLLPSKTVVREKFDELASWKTVELGTPDVASSASSAKKTKKPKKRLCWVVPAELLQKYQLPELPLQNQWDYTLTPKVNEGADAPQHEQSPPADAETTISPVVTAPAKAAATTPTTGQTTPASQGAKKRATLIMSVARDQPIHSATKNKLISQFLRRQNEAKEKKQEKPPPAVSEDVVMLSD
ncbi:chromatin assembly factor 1 subunit A-B [Drosophila rhopaloa]|uniref:Chromatin assembly factor 1 subunit A-B n=1 Tax=Drosophila rhopaloa TaxID=1041015 RepID=A0A6P4FB48_DRORH|nr:chromatin assembly factor 1 subunit A-B [Drosophila rhopaloa]